MKCKKLLATFLLGAGLCFVPALGYGEVKVWMFKGKASCIDYLFLKARVEYMMRNPMTFMDINFSHDSEGSLGRAFLPKGQGIDTKGKIFV